MGNGRHFSLLELLVVVALLGVLAALMLPAMAASRRKAMQVSCLHVMKQYAMATSLYADTYADFFPDIRTYLLPSSGFLTHLGVDGTLPRSLARCAGDAETERLGRLGVCRQGGDTTLLSIGGTVNLSDSRTPTSHGVAAIPQHRAQTQNRFPSRRCQWTDYQATDQLPVDGAALSIAKGYGSPRDSLAEYVFRHPGNSTNGAFADAHAQPIRLLAAPLLHGGHDLAAPWIFPGNLTWPFGPRQADGFGGLPALAFQPGIKF